VTGVVILFAVLLLPIVLWGIVRWLPERRGRRSPKAAAPTGPRKRWWQP